MFSDGRANVHPRFLAESRAHWKTDLCRSNRARILAVVRYARLIPVTLMTAMHPNPCVWKQRMALTIAAVRAKNTALPHVTLIAGILYALSRREKSVLTLKMQTLLFPENALLTAAIVLFAEMDFVILL